MVLALTAACGTTTMSNRASSSAKPLSSDTSPAATAAPPVAATPAATANSVLGTVEFSCQLPMVTYRNQAPEAGFISFPGGSFAADPAANIKSVAFGLAYDRVYRRWLPVDWRLVSDDGTRYTYVTYSDTSPSPGAFSVIHIVNVSTGADRVLSRSGQYVIDDYVGQGIYLSAWVGGHDGPGPQIGWVLDPSTGDIRSLNGGQIYGYWIGSGAGWRTDYNQADPTVHQGMTGPNRLTRVDLASAVEATWFYQQGTDSVQVLGFDQAGHPIVSSSTGQVVTVWLLSDASHRSALFTGSIFMNWAIADSHGIWFSDGGATYLYSAASSLQKVAATGGQFAGGCH